MQDVSTDMRCFMLQRCQQDANNGKFKLRDILSVPMQRILKYHLLLDKLINETQPVSTVAHTLSQWMLLLLPRNLCDVLKCQAHQKLNTDKIVDF